MTSLNVPIREQSNRCTQWSGTLIRWRFSELYWLTRQTAFFFFYCDLWLKAGCYSWKHDSWTVILLPFVCVHSLSQYSCINVHVYSGMGGSSSIYCTSMRLLSLKSKCWPWLDINGSLRDRLFHHSEMERFPSHNTAIKFHQGSLHADSMSSPVHCKIPPCKHTEPQRCIIAHTHTHTHAIVGQCLLQ